jgi:hypothetical protein
LTQASLQDIFSQFRNSPPNRLLSELVANETEYGTGTIQQTNRAALGDTAVLGSGADIFSHTVKCRIVRTA